MNFQIYKPILIFFILEIFFGYLILNPPINNNAKLSLNMQKNIIYFFSIIIIILIFYAFYPAMKDTFCYLIKDEKKCIQQTKCIIKETTATPIFFFAKKNIYCKNGQQFKVFFTFNNYFKDEFFIFNYLLNSRILINEKLIYSPYKKRLNKIKVN